MKKRIESSPIKKSVVKKGTRNQRMGNSRSSSNFQKKMSLSSTTSPSSFPSSKNHSSSHHRHPNNTNKTMTQSIVKKYPKPKHLKRKMEQLQSQLLFDMDNSVSNKTTDLSNHNNHNTIPAATAADGIHLQDTIQNLLKWKNQHQPTKKIKISSSSTLLAQPTPQPILKKDTLLLSTKNTPLVENRHHHDDDDDSDSMGSESSSPTNNMNQRKRGIRRRRGRGRREDTTVNTSQSLKDESGSSTNLIKLSSSTITNNTNHDITNHVDGNKTTPEETVTGVFMDDPNVSHQEHLSTTKKELSLSSSNKKQRRCIGRKPITDFQVGSIYTGKIVYIKPTLGIFIDINCHSDAFCHVSEMTDKEKHAIGDVLPHVQILQVNRKKKQITVTLRHVDPSTITTIPSSSLLSSSEQKEKQKHVNNKPKEYHPTDRKQQEDSIPTNIEKKYQNHPMKEKEEKKQDKIKTSPESPQMQLPLNHHHHHINNNNNNDLKRQRKLERRAQRRLITSSK